MIDKRLAIVMVKRSLAAAKAITPGNSVNPTASLSIAINRQTRIL
jgi:hypothetical protein